MSGYLIIRLKGLGDIIHLIPSLQMIRENEPNTPIGFLCQKPFGDIIPNRLNVKIFELPAHAGIKETIKIIKHVKTQHYDKLLDLYGNPRTAVLSFSSNIPQRYGFDYRIRKYAYSKTFQPKDSNLHLTKLFHNFFSYFGINGNITTPNLDLSKDAILYARTLINENRIGNFPILGINPHTTYPSKAWPTEYFIKFIKLWHKTTGGKCLITWGPNEIEKTNLIINNVGKHLAFTHKAISISAFAALLSELDLFLTADTGPMNIAWAVKTPTITLFGPTTRRAVAPVGPQHLTLFRKEVKCLQCHKEVCNDMQCMNKMTPEWVLDKILEKYLKK